MKVKYVNPNILLELKEKNHETYNNLKQKFPDFDLWIEQKNYPTYEQLLEISEIFNIPFGYFFLEKLPNFYNQKIINEIQKLDELLINIIELFKQFPDDNLLQLNIEQIEYRKKILTEKL